MHDPWNQGQLRAPSLRLGCMLPKILLADDHAIVRLGLRQLLLDGGSGYETGEAASGRETLEKLRHQHWDLLILDIHMPDRSGMDILHQVHVNYPGTRVLVLSGLPAKQYAVNVLRAGASGYLGKEMAPEELTAAVKTVLAGRRYVDTTLADLLVSELDRDCARPAHAQLSEREFQVFCKLAHGRSVSEIATELCLSVKTISTYRARVIDKMGFSNNADITAYALRHEIIQ